MMGLSIALLVLAFLFLAFLSFIQAAIGLAIASFVVSGFQLTGRAIVGLAFVLPIAQCAIGSTVLIGASGPIVWWAMSQAKANSATQEDANPATQLSQQWLSTVLSLAFGCGTLAATFWLASKISTDIQIENGIALFQAAVILFFVPRALNHYIFQLEESEKKPRSTWLSALVGLVGITTLPIIPFALAWLSHFPIFGLAKMTPFVATIAWAIFQTFSFLVQALLKLLKLLPSKTMFPNFKIPILDRVPLALFLVAFGLGIYLGYLWLAARIVAGFAILHWGGPLTFLAIVVATAFLRDLAIDFVKLMLPEEYKYAQKTES